ncbi:peptidase M20 domain-containing protein 2-like [Ruditapes philippinarum]|uniref:peptidase M20 domain-containing protein 2-like n=1 Tax=Ruditapes philippinarum TaxID=129788 RepID=UPI00295AA855|nr:peptidase M20 domain-containing protein 2-like [Ruditapes philippinarum]
MKTKEELKKIASNAIDNAAVELKEISDQIWKHPELGNEEFYAHDLLTDFLAKHGFQTEKSYKMDTAFRGSYGSLSVGPNVAILCEYDALPSLGHACGHNLISELGLAAGIGIKAAIEHGDEHCGKVTVLGTPDEEGHGGKIELIKAGAFDDVTAAMMSHGYPISDPAPVLLARETLEVTFYGKASHAAGYPWEGVNALDAAVTCYNSIACLRQQIKPTWRIHTIIIEGGEKVNIIPEKAVIQVCVRAPTNKEMEDLKAKITEILKSSAKANGCQVEWITSDQPFAAMVNNPTLVSLYEQNISLIQTDTVPSAKGGHYGSTDMGNVSQVVPSIRPIFYFGSDEANHTRGFAKDSGSPKAQPYALIQAKVLAHTAIDVFMDTRLQQEIEKEFKQMNLN